MDIIYKWQLLELFDMDPSSLQMDEEWTLTNPSFIFLEVTKLNNALFQI